MKRAAIALLCAVGLSLTPAAAHAVTLIDSNGQPVGGVWQQWADQAQVPTLGGNLDLVVSSDPAVRGCSSAGCSAASGSLVLQDGQITAPWAGTQATTWMAPDADQWTFYWELGHQFDWATLTDDRRHQFTDMWRSSLPWWNSVDALNRGVEDGLESTFAAVYANCASGHPAITPGGWIDLLLPDPQASCALIDQIGGWSVAPTVSAVTVTVSSPPQHRAHHRHHRSVLRRHRRA